MLKMQLSWQAPDRRETFKVAKSKSLTCFEGSNRSRTREECGHQTSAAPTALTLSVFHILCLIPPSRAVGMAPFGLICQYSRTAEGGFGPCPWRRALAVATQGGFLALENLSPWQWCFGFFSDEQRPPENE